MSESTHIARQRDPPPRRRVSKLTRPRSGSWHAQELHYYMNNADDDLRQHGRASRFLSKLKMQRSPDSLPGSSSVMTLSSVPPSEPSLANNKQKRRPPLPLEMVHPDQSAHSTPHPSLARHDDKPVEPALFAMTPAAKNTNSSKKVGCLCCFFCA